ncbi:MAG TPA: hypothetical protein VHA75_00580, partial [Rugosimonospora sp.]|nr:hypothetical protein [Rugosimonospora sp.]
GAHARCAGERERQRLLFTRYLDLTRPGTTEPQVAAVVAEAGGMWPMPQQIGRDGISHAT